MLLWLIFLKVNRLKNNLLNNFLNTIKDKHIAFAGISRSNLPLIKIFLKHGIHTTICDTSTSDSTQITANSLKNLGAKVSLGKDYLSDVNPDILFRTPGINFLNPDIIKLKESGVVVTSEMEIFFDLCPCMIIAVTGSDGKTTTTTLISKFLEKANKTVHLGGNIGKPLLPNIESFSNTDIAVVELSSFQLISMRKSPDIAVITNISPNHLDVHKNMDEYINAKKNILLHQNAFSSTILNFDNEITKSFSPLVRGKILGFTMHDVSSNKNFTGAYLRSDGMICMKISNTITPIIHRDDICIPGLHNLENCLTAITATWDYVSIENIREVAKTFTGVPHRTEFVAEIEKVRYYNDSIASSPTRTIKGTLSLYDQKIILICGGYDKKISFDDLGKQIAKKVKLLILIGQTAKLIKKAVLDADENKTVTILSTSTLKEAVLLARKRALPGDIVSLSPACASFDMYKDFEARGNDFKNIVLGLTK